MPASNFNPAAHEATVMPPARPDRGPLAPYARSGFSPDLTRLLMEALVRHGDDMALVSERLRRIGRQAARSQQEAEEFASIAAEIERLTRRIKIDAGRAVAESGKLGIGPIPITYCACGRAIETGDCKTGGTCHRGLAVNLNS